jgi:hypothetical protein
MIMMNCNVFPLISCKASYWLAIASQAGPTTKVRILIRELYLGSQNENPIQNLNSQLLSWEEHIYAVFEGMPLASCTVKK